MDVAASCLRIRDGKTRAAAAGPPCRADHGGDPRDDPARRPHGRTESVRGLHHGHHQERDDVGLPGRWHPALLTPYLRHRYASVKIAEGVPVTDLAAQLGHARKSLTLDIYGHVLLAG